MNALHVIGRGLTGLTLTLVLLLAAGPADAQDEGPGSTGPQPGATAVPLDGGALLLLASGLVYGFKKLRQRRMR